MMPRYDSVVNPEIRGKLSVRRLRRGEVTQKECKLGHELPTLRGSVLLEKGAESEGCVWPWSFTTRTFCSPSQDQSQDGLQGESLAAVFSGCLDLDSYRSHSPGHTSEKIKRSDGSILWKGRPSAWRRHLTLLTLRRVWQWYVQGDNRAGRCVYGCSRGQRCAMLDKYITGREHLWLRN